MNTGKWQRLGMLFGAFALALPAAAEFPELVSRGDSEILGDWQSINARASSDGRYIAFASFATNLVANDNNGLFDVFVRDRTLNSTERVSIASGGAQGAGDSGYLGPGSVVTHAVAISGDGNRVAFLSSAENLVATDGNGRVDAFVRDRLAGTTVLVSRSSLGQVADRDTFQVAISRDGRYVAFATAATNLVPGDSNENPPAFQTGIDIFVHDLQNATTERVSLDSNEAQGFSINGSRDPALSSDGRFVVFSSEVDFAALSCAGQCADVYIRDRQAGTTVVVSLTHLGDAANGSSRLPQISGDGRYVVFRSGSTTLVPNDSNGQEDVFLRDRNVASTERISVTTAGGESSVFCELGAASDDGRFVAFSSRQLTPDDTNLADDVFIRDRSSAQTLRISVSAAQVQANSASSRPFISPDGRLVVFESSASNLIAGDSNGRTDIFLADNPFVVDAPAQIVGSGDQRSSAALVSNFGRYLVFQSNAGNLVAGDSNNSSDIFRKDLMTGSIVRVSVDNLGQQLQAGAKQPSITADGDLVLFAALDDGSIVTSAAPVGTVPGLNGTAPGSFIALFVRRVSSGQTWRIGPPNANGNSGQPVVSHDGTRVVFRSSATNLLPIIDGNSFDDVFLADLNSGTVLQRISVSQAGVPGNGHSSRAALTSSGRFVAFETLANNLVPGVSDTNNAADILVRDLIDNTLYYVSSAGPGGPTAANGPSSGPIVPHNLRRVLWIPTADNFGPADNNLVADAYMFDFDSMSLSRVSEGLGGIEGNAATTSVSISGDGQQIAFASAASNLSAYDSNAVADIFVRTLASGVLTRVARTDGGTQTNATSASPSLSYDGRFVAFESEADNISFTDTNGATADVLLRGDVPGADRIFRNGFDN